MHPDLTQAAWRSALPFFVGAGPPALMSVEQSSSSLLWGAYASLTSTVKQFARPASDAYERADEEDEDLIWDDEDAADDSPDGSTASTNSRQSYAAEDSPDIGPTCPPQPLAPGNYCPKCKEQSSILREVDLMALAAAVPLRHKWRDWQLLYSSSRYSRQPQIHAQPRLLGVFQTSVSHLVLVPCLSCVVQKSKIHVCYSYLLIRCHAWCFTKYTHAICCGVCASLKFCITLCCAGHFFGKWEWSPTLQSIV